MSSNAPTGVCSVRSKLRVQPQAVLQSVMALPVALGPHHAQFTQLGAPTQQPRPAGSFWTARLNRARAAAAAAVDSDIAVVNTTLDTAPAARSSATHATCASLAVPDEQVPTDQPIATSDLVMAPADPMADTPSTHVHADVAGDPAVPLSVNEGAAVSMPPDTMQDACNLDISIDEAWLAACTELP